MAKEDHTGMEKGQRQAEGGFGAFAVEVLGRPLPDNPKSSSLTALSVLRAVENLAACLVI